MVSVASGGSGRTIYHANPGHGTDKESKSPPNGRASGTVRRSVDGEGSVWPSWSGLSLVLNEFFAQAGKLGRLLWTSMARKHTATAA